MTPQNKKERNSISGQVKRPPVVVVVGHIDHGKSTLLDHIRKTNVTEKEHGGITQHLSAYEAEVEIDERREKITFLDTPGHEAFCTIRERGTKAADIAVLVISAEDGVKPQTLEALDCIKKNQVPFIVALNKIDKPNANPNKVKQDLAENGILVEGWGGTIPIAAISAKTGEGVTELLELIALQSDLEGFTGNPSLLAEGFVIESHLNPQQGISATLIIKNGTLKTGSFVATEGAYAPVRGIENYGGEILKESTFSSPVRIVGWTAGPKVGSSFKTFSKKEEAAQFAALETEKKDGEQKVANDGQVFFDVIVKADTFGSLDAVEHELKKLGSDKVAIRIISKDVGIITEKDIKTAKIKRDLILGFNVKTDRSAEGLALRENIEIKTFQIIYDLVDFVKEKVKEATPIETVETEVGSAKILKTFSKNKDKQVVGGRVESGEIKAGAIVKIYRRENLIGSGKIKELQVQKIKAEAVKDGQEFGMMVESKIDLVPGDYLKATEMVRQ